MYLSNRSWKQIKEICPIKCRAVHLKKGEGKPLRGKTSLKFRAVPGKLTVKEERYIWVFSHPGFNKDIRISNLNGDMKPETNSVYFFE